MHSVTKSHPLRGEMPVSDRSCLNMCVRYLQQLLHGGSSSRSVSGPTTVMLCLVTSSTTCLDFVFMHIVKTWFRLQA